MNETNPRPTRREADAALINRTLRGQFADDRKRAVDAIADFLGVRAREERLVLPVDPVAVHPEGYTLLAEVCGVPVYDEDLVGDVDVRQRLAERLVVQQPLPTGATVG